MKKYFLFLIVSFLCFSCSTTGDMASIGSMDEISLVRLDPGTAQKEEDSQLLWFDAKNLSIEGRVWSDTAEFYNRLPSRVEGKVTKNVWKLSKHTAGICVRFVTDSKQIGAIWDGGSAMYHMAATGNSGLDLYVRKKEGWIFCGVGKPNKERTTRILSRGRPGKPEEYILYLPLYNKITELKIGIEEGAFLAPAPPRPLYRKPIVFYGTSITQGGCASRCGMCHTALVGRWLDREVVNLGFSGAGKMEAVMANLLGEIDASLYILECLPNMTPNMIRKRYVPFVHILREARPETPILIVKSPLGGRESGNNRALEEVIGILQSEGVKNLHILEGENQLAGRENGTVDGVHPTDLGFFRMAEIYEPVLRGILGD